MSNLIEKNMQTPIEIALGVDEKGMTTARKLYDFLGLSSSNYSKWCKNNIIDNEFATENEDYVYSSSSTSESGRGNFAQDFKLTARFAKKLSMMQKNERGELARDYFTKVEDKAVDMANILQNLSNNPLKVLELHYEAIKHVDKKVDEVDTKVEDVKADLENFKQEMPIFGVDEKRITTAVHKKGVEVLGGKKSNAYNDKSLHDKAFRDIYRELKLQFGITGTYKQLRRNQCDKAIEIIEAYQPPMFLAEQIVNCNAQMKIEQ